MDAFNKNFDLGSSNQLIKWLLKKVILTVFWDMKFRLTLEYTSIKTIKENIEGRNYQKQYKQYKNPVF